MKRPIRPNKPYAPNKPQPPAHQIEQNTELGTVCLENYDTSTMEEFIGGFVSLAGGIDPKNIRVSCEIDQKRWYYDEVIVSVKLNVRFVGIIDNPHYDTEYQSYLEKMEIYRKGYKEYRVKLKQYKEDYAKYELAESKYRLQCDKNKLLRLQQKADAKK